MNKIGLHIGYFVSDWSADQLPYVARAAELGFDALEIGIDYIRSFDEAMSARIREEAEKHNITLLCSGGLSPEMDIGSPVAAERKQGIAFLSEAAVKMRKAGIGMCNGLTHGAWNGNANLTDYAEKRVFRENAVRSLKELCKVYEDNQVIFNVEVVNRFENFLLNTAEEARNFVDEVDSECVGIHLDTFHMNIEERSFVEAINIAGEKLNFFHIGENNRVLPGLGMLPWKMIFDSLKNIKYSGIISMETFLNPQGSVGRSVSLFRNLLEEVEDKDELLRDSLAFVKHLL